MLELTFWEVCQYLLVSNKNEHLLSTYHRQAWAEKFTFILSFDA